jgi:RNA polymerase sigma factor (TIGR02999 family)
LVLAKPELDQRFAELYGELKTLAAAQLQQSPQATLSATGLVHELYLKWQRCDAVLSEHQEHFFTLAARAMRNLLIDRARGAAAVRRGAAWVRTTLSSNEIAALDGAIELLDVNECLTRLERASPELGALMQLRLFGGLEADELAQLRGESERTIHRRLLAGRAVLMECLGVMR